MCPPYMSVLLSLTLQQLLVSFLNRLSCLGCCLVTSEHHVTVGSPRWKQCAAIFAHCSKTVLLHRSVRPRPCHYHDPEVWVLRWWPPKNQPTGLQHEKMIWSKQHWSQTQNALPLYQYRWRMHAMKFYYWILTWSWQTSRVSRKFWESPSGW